MNLLLKIDSNRAVDANDLVSANSGVGGNVTTGVGNYDVVGNVPDVMVGAFNGRRYQLARELFSR